MGGIVFDKRGKRVRLDEISAEPPKGMTRARAEERLAELGKELFELQDRLWGARTRSVMVVLQGRDSAGKDGAIKHVVGFLNPRGVSVTCSALTMLCAMSSWMVKTSLSSRS